MLSKLICACCPVAEALNCVAHGPAQTVVLHYIESRPAAVRR